MLRHKMNLRKHWHLNGLASLSVDCFEWANHFSTPVHSTHNWGNLLLSLFLQCFTGVLAELSSAWLGIFLGFDCSCSFCFCFFVLLAVENRIVFLMLLLFSVCLPLVYRKSTEFLSDNSVSCPFPEGMHEPQAWLNIMALCREVCHLQTGVLRLPPFLFESPLFAVLV